MPSSGGVLLDNSSQCPTVKQLQEKTNCSALDNTKDLTDQVIRCFKLL